MQFQSLLLRLVPTQAGSEVVTQPVEAPIQVVPVPAAAADAPLAEPVAVPAAKRARQYALPSQQPWRPIPDLQPLLQPPHYH